MPDRSRNRYTSERVRAVLAEDSAIRGRDASCVRALEQGFRGEAGKGLVPKIAESMNAWVEVDQSGDPERPDFWIDWKNLAASAFRREQGG
jgi:hypothetical protein